MNNKTTSPLPRVVKAKRTKNQLNSYRTIRSLSDLEEDEENDFDLYDHLSDTMDEEIDITLEKK